MTGLCSLLSTSSGSVEAAPPAAVEGLAAVAAVVVVLRAGLSRRRPQPEESVVWRGGGEEGVLLGDHARLLVVGRVGLAQHQAIKRPVNGPLTNPAMPSLKTFPISEFDTPEIVNGSTGQGCLLVIS